MTIDNKKPLVLVIMDGWGLNPQESGNAIAKAATPNMDSFAAKYPNTTLACSGEDVGLPDGQMGNSEVGHLNIGAGRRVYQEFTRISLAVRDKSIFQNKIITEAVDYVKKQGSALHLLGLLSDGGVHSHIDHLFALLELAAKEKLPRVYVHAFLDGRDVPPANAKEYFASLGAKTAELNCGEVASVMGRYYAMDRDKRWERVEKAYNAMVLGTGFYAANAMEAVDNGYSRGETDEFIQPTVITGPDGKPVARISQGDAVICFNFRPDRAREITRALVDKDFNGFTRGEGYPRVDYTCLTMYDATIEAKVAFPPQTIDDTLGQILGREGITQLRLAETEKYAHVTFFFNGGVEEPNPGEERILIPSPKVATYDLKPEMSAPEVTEVLLEQIEADKFGVIIVNYANTDMVGHTGVMDAAIKAANTVDGCLGRVSRAVLGKGGTLLITADHGNAEVMVGPDGKIHTAHTTNLVPFLLLRPDVRGMSLRSGSLQDIAPTILNLLGITKPEVMTGESLIANG